MTGDSARFWIRTVPFTGQASGPAPWLLDWAPGSSAETIEFTPWGLVRARREDIPAVVKTLALWWRQRDDAIDGHPHNCRLTKPGNSAIEGR